MHPVLMSIFGGWLPDLLSCFLVFLAAWTLLRRRLTNFAKRLGYSPSRDLHSEVAREHMKALKRSIPPRGISRPWATFFLAVIAGSWILWGTTAIVDHQRIRDLQAQLDKYRTDQVIEHDVQFFGQDKYGDWFGTSREEPNSLVYHKCPGDLTNGLDVDGIIRPAVQGHYVADHAIWEERGDCKSILRSDQGFWWPSSFNSSTKELTYRRSQ
jgi:hypothetical protein